MNKHSKSRSAPADGIIIHSMAEYVGEKYCTDFLESIGLSAHFFVSPLGHIIHGVDHSRIAYHAGKSKLGEQENLNSTFIGIEVLVEGKHSWGSFVEAIKNPETFNDSQYKSTAKICRDLMIIYPDITTDRIVRHSDVSGKDVRPDPKIDPGKGFSMERLKTGMGICNP